jgi:hypothetical protein
MPEQYFVLDENDRQLFLWMLDEERKRNRGSVSPSNQATEIRQTQAPECYVALTPAGGIPARSGIVPGVANCNIYQLKLNQSTNKVELVAIPQFVQKVYNVSGRAATAGIYVVVRREKYGVFVYECPCT